MPNLQSSLILRLVDEVSLPARKVEAALKQATQQIRAIETAMKGTGLSSRFQQQLSQLGTSAAGVEKVAAAFRDYARSAGLAENATNWTRAQVAQVKSWETATIASLKRVQAAEKSFGAGQQALGGLPATVGGRRGEAIQYRLTAKKANGRLAMTEL